MQDPLERFADWLGRARAVDRALLPEPTAFALATVSREGKPAVRMLLLKDVSQKGFTFYTNLESRKGIELQQTGVAAMCFHWSTLDLQVRVEGHITPVSPVDADEYFASRPRESQLGAWASIQSRPIATEGDLARRVAEMDEKFRGQSVPRPPHWSGFLLTPERIEFWEGRPYRLHDRLVYVRNDSAWSAQKLYP
jgi:pyridoxamine 5'-phosphate oxidase